MNILSNIEKLSNSIIISSSHSEKLNLNVNDTVSIFFPNDPPVFRKLKIKSINMIKRHTKPTKENKGGIVSKESFIHQSNVKNIDLKKKEKKTVLNLFFQINVLLVVQKQ